MELQVRSALFARGKTVSLHPLIRADIPYYVRWLNDPEVRRAFPFHIAPVSEAQAAKWVEDGALTGIHRQTFTIASVAGEPIGALGFRELSHRDRRALVDVVFAAEYLDQAALYADAINLIAAYAFDNESLHKLLFEIPEDGIHALREGLKQVGAEEEAVLQKHLFLRGAFRNVQIWALFEDRWREYQRLGEG